MGNKKIAMLAFTDNGRLLCKKIEKEFGEDVEFLQNSSGAKSFLCDNYSQVYAIIFVGAVGIAVRLIKEHITTKDKDPAVIVIDEQGKFVIPILSGHLGGANELALTLASKLNATPVITTATDLNKCFAVDLWTKENELKIVDIGKIKFISSAILKGDAIGFHSDFKVSGAYPFECDNSANVGIDVSFSGKATPFENTLNLVPKILTLGVGCRKGVDEKEFEAFILRVLNEHKISVDAIEKIASIDIKKDEGAILRFSEKYGIPFMTSSATELNEVRGDFSKSDFVKSIVGVDNVCERSAVFHSDMGEIILSKQSENGMTLALAKREWKCRF